MTDSNFGSSPIITSKASILPTSRNTNIPIYQNYFTGYDENEVYFSQNPENFNLKRALKNPNFNAKKESYRQGDILIVSIDTLPCNVERMNTTVLAESITTKNTHEILYGNVKIYGCNITKHFYMVVENEPAILGHKESQLDRIAHAAQVIQPGVYQIKFQQTWFDNRPISVID